MLLAFWMLLLVGLFVLWAALVRFAEGIIIPQDHIHDKARRETLQSCEPASAEAAKETVMTLYALAILVAVLVIYLFYAVTIRSGFYPAHCRRSTHDGAFVAADRIGVAHQFWS